MEPEYENGARGTEFPWNSTPSGLNARMSAFGYKRTYSGQLANVRFTPDSGHSDGAGHRYVIRMLFVYSPLFLRAGAM